MAAGLRIAFVSREVAPLYGGGIGTYVSAIAAALAPLGEVAVFTTDRHRGAHERLLAEGDERLAGLRLRFVAEPRAWEVEDYQDSRLYAWSARAFEALLAEYPDGGPDLVEFADFLGEGLVTAQAAASQDPRLRRTTVCVRLQTTARMTDVLNGHLADDFEPRLTYELERGSLAACDHVIWPGGDVLATYERQLGPLPGPVQIRHPLSGFGAEPIPTERGPGLKLLYLGRLERRKGVLDLARALTGIADPGLRLTIAGADTHTAPLGGSMRELLGSILGADPRVRFCEPQPRPALAALFEAHDVVVAPSLWENWPAVALEALERDRPLLATPTGGFLEIVQAGRSGWLCDGVGAEPLARAIERLAADPGQVEELRDSGRPREVFAELTDPEGVRERYAELAASPPPREQRPGRRPARGCLVSIVIPYFHLAAYVAEAVASAARQTYRPTELIVVNDGSFEPADAILGELERRFELAIVTQPNSGLGAARNAGAAQARGEYVFFLDADNVAHPRFVERCVAALEADPSFAYATSWARYVDARGEPWGTAKRGLRPLGNWTALVDERNLAGDANAVFRRRLFDHGLRFSQELTSFEDWALYRRLRREGMHGHVICEELFDYRIRSDSMTRELGAPNASRIEGELRAHLEESELRWTTETTR